MSKTIEQIIEEFDEQIEIIKKNDVGLSVGFLDALLKIMGMFRDGLKQTLTQFQKDCRQEVIEDCKGCVPEEWTKTHLEDKDHQWQAFGYNQCRVVTLDNINKLK